jgi:ubiquinone/menaquinone biosynthesis C-methylase UbiE
MIDRDPLRFKQFYEKEASIYHDLRYETRYGKLFRQLHYGCMSELLGPLDKELELLEVACGTGHTSALLAGLGFKSTACDLTPQMLAQARQRVSKIDSSHVNFLEASAMKLPFSDAVFDVLVSTRFLHLFPPKEQEVVLTEMLRVLKPGGKILVDFDNWTSRWIMMIPFAVYNLLRYQRLAPYSIYNRIQPTRKKIDELGVTIDKIMGVGGTHLVAPALYSESMAEKIGIQHRGNPLRILAEQFIIFGTKR